MIQQSICIHSQNTKDRFSFNDIIQKKKKKEKILSQIFKRTRFNLISNPTSQWKVVMAMKIFLINLIDVSKI